MTRNCFFCPLLLAFAFSLLFVGQAFAQQEGESKEKPNQLDILKVDLLQLGVNEVRFSYEIELSKQSSIEVGAGYIFRNAFWYDRGDRPMLANGAGIYFAMRKYMDKKKYFSEPKLRSYVSPHIFYRYTTLEDEWLGYTTTDPGLFDCTLISEKIHQLGAVLRFGWQTSRGRLVFDFYSGLGFKFIPSTLRTHVITPLTGSCQINSTSYAVSEEEKFNGANVIINGGVKIGLRRNNRERNYGAAPAVDPSEPDGSAPPKF